MSNEIVMADNADKFAAVRSTLKGSDTITRRRVFKAVTTAESLTDHVGETILVEHIVQQKVTGEPEVDDVTGEVRAQNYTRTILVGPEGSPSYVAASKGIENSVDSILAILGDPNTWDEPEAFVITKQGKKPREFYTLEMA